MTEEKRREIRAAYRRNGNNASLTSTQLGIPRTTVRRVIASEDRPLAAGRIEAQPAIEQPRVRAGVRRYICTSAQNNTLVNDVVLENMRALQAYYGIADVDFLCATYTYNKNAFGEKSVKRGAEVEKDRSLWYDPAIGGPELFDRSDRDIMLAPGLMWHGRANILPTARHPLKGLEHFSGRASVIVPHATVAMQSVDSEKSEAAKLMWSTGTVTQRNYIQKREGIRAETMHAYGGLIVEVTSDGWWVRQVHADADGSLFDLDLVARDGVVTKHNRVRSVTPGDLHVVECDPEVWSSLWGAEGLIDLVQPEEQFIHDLTSFVGRSHHDSKDCHRRFERFVDGSEDVGRELEACAEALVNMSRPFCKTIVVRSNHDAMIDRWLVEGDYKNDCVNSILFLELQLAKYKAIKARDRKFLLIEHALRNFYGGPDSIRFLREDEGYIVCEEHEGGIQQGNHGHLGPRGTRGSPQGFARMGRRISFGHGHGACILWWAWMAGACSPEERTSYARGPGNWSASHIVTGPTGTRQMVTSWRGKCYAPRP